MVGCQISIGISKRSRLNLAIPEFLLTNGLGYFLHGNLTLSLYLPLLFPPTKCAHFNRLLHEPLSLPIPSCSVLIKEMKI